MKTIFRYTNIAALMAAFIVLGAVAGFSQDPCADAAGLTAAQDNIQTLFKDKTLAGRKAYVDAGKAFLEKYGTCESAKDTADYFKANIPKLEEVIRQKQRDEDIAKLTTPFDAALKAKNLDEVFSTGKQILAKFPDDFRLVEIALGAAGGEEALKGNNKYADDGLMYAKQSIADLEAGKSFMIGNKTAYGISLKGGYNFEFPNKEDALGWMNLYAGYITNAVKKDKAGSLPFLYKATQANSESKSKPAPYELIGAYYVDELNKLYDEIQALAKTQSDSDTAEVAKQKVDAIKAKVALANGTAERVIDAYSRAANNTADAAGKARLKNIASEVYKRRFEKTDGLDAWVATSIAKPFVSPQTPVQPIFDPEPVKPAATTTTTTPTKSEAMPAKPTTTTPAKPSAAPAAKTMKPQAKMKKTVAKKFRT
jgi:hypothetical protein